MNILLCILAGPGDILDRNLKLILDLVWCLILRYQIAKKGTEQNLLEWLNTILPNNDISNFTSDWNDGLNLSALIEYCKPGLFPDHATLNAENGLPNTEHAMELAEENFGIPRLLDPEDLSTTDPDEHSVITYLSYFCCQNSPGQAALQTWIQQQIPDQGVKNMTASWVSGIALGALTHAVSKGNFPDYEQMSPEEAVENCTASMNAAEDILGIEKTLEPEEFADPDLDQLKRITYLVQFQQVKLPPKVIDLHIPAKTGGEEMVWLDLECFERTSDSEKIRASVKGTTFGRIPVHIESLSPTKYRIRFQAQKPDTYTLSVHYGPHRVKGSPFSINLSPPDPFSVKKTRTITPQKVGEAVFLSFDISEAGRGELSAKTTGETSGVIPTEVDQLSLSDYKVSFIASRQDVYHIEIKLEDQEIRGSPFTFDLRSIADPSKVECSEAEYSEPGEPVHISVDVSNAGRGKLTANCDGEKVGEIDVEIVTTDDRQNDITFTPPEEDIYTLSVFYEGSEVKGSPFEINALISPPIPDKVSVHEPPSGTLAAGEEVRISFDTSKAGKGKLTASCNGDHVGEIPVEVNKYSKDKYEVKFTPPEEDLYAVSILWSDSHIRGSPFSINLIPKGRPDPSKCHIVNLDETPKMTSLIEELHFKIITAAAGKGTLSVIVEGLPEGETPVPVISTSEKDPSTYSVAYTPAIPGIHKLHLKWADQDIPGSPISIEAIAAKTFAFGHPIVYDFKTEHKRKNMHAYTLQAGKSKGSQIKAKIDKVKTGHFKLVCQPKEPGIYYLHAITKHKDIVGSPFPVNYTKRARPEACTVIGLRENAYVGDAFHFTVDAKEAGDGEVFVLRRIPEGLRLTARLPRATSRQSLASYMEESDFTVIDNGDGTHTVEYIPDAPGEYDVDVLFAGTPVGGSPFRISVQSFRPEQLEELEELEELTESLQEDEGVTGLDLHNAKFQVGVSYQITLHCEQLGDNPPAISCKPKDAANVIVTSAPGRNSYNCEIIPQKEGKHIISVKYEGKHIFGSPFTVKFKPQAQAAACRVIETSPECQKQAGDNVIFCISTDGAGKGKLTATAKSLTTKNHIPVSIKHPHKHHYNVEFNPTEGSQYTLTIKYNDQHITGSPFALSLGDASKCHAEGEGLTSAQIEKEGRFTVYTEGAGLGTLSVEIQGEGQTTLDSNVSQKSENQFEVSYLPDNGGAYNIFVRWGDVEIPGSPFPIMCIDPAQFTITEQESQTCHGKDIQLMVTSEVDTEEEKLTISSLQKSSQKTTEGTVEKVKDLTYTCNIKPPEIGMYTIRVCWGGVDIQGSPFDLEVEKAPAPEDFTVEAREVNAETLGLRVYGPKRALKYGELTATVRSAATNEQLPVVVTQATLDWCDVEFHPQGGSGSEYLLSIQYNGDHIIGSPFRLLSTDASQCYTKGKGLVTARTGEWNKFTVYTENAGPGKLTVHIEGEDGEELESFITAKNETDFQVRYNPTVPGNYTIAVQWRNQDIPHSPFSVYCCNPSAFQVMEPPNEVYLGEQIKVFLDAAQAATEQEELCIFARAKHKKDVHGIVRKVEEETKYICTVEPPSLGKYVIHIRCNDFEVKGSSFKVRAMPPPVPENVKVHGPGIVDGIVGEERNFTIDVTEAGHSFVTFKVHGPKDAFKVNMHNHPELEKTILAEYNPSHEGVFTISVLWAGSHVPGSPFSVRILEAEDLESNSHDTLSGESKPTPAKCIVTGPEIPPEMNEPVQLQVDASNAGSGKLAAKIVGDKSGISKVQIKEVQPKVYDLSFKPPAPELYTLSATWAGEPIPGSPFMLNLAPPNAKEVMIAEPPSTSLRIGQAIKICFGTSMAGRGELTANCKGNKVGEIPVKVTKRESQSSKYDIELTPLEEDLYSLRVQWGGADVKGSPFAINLTDTAND